MMGQHIFMMTNFNFKGQGNPITINQMPNNLQILVKKSSKSSIVVEYPVDETSRKVKSKLNHVVYIQIAVIFDDDDQHFL